MPLKQLRLSIQALVPGLGRNNPLPATAACNHPLPSSITIIYSEAALTVGECSLRNNAGGVTHECPSSLLGFTDRRRLQKHT